MNDIYELISFVFVDSTDYFNALGMENGNIADGQLAQSYYLLNANGHRSSLSAR